jgi:hypothetical protein
MAEMAFKGLQAALLARHTNTLHGFNALTDGSYLILGILTWTKLETQPLSATASSDLGVALLRGKLSNESRRMLQLAVDNKFDFVSMSYGGECLQLPVDIRHLAGDAIDTARRLGYHVRLQTKLRSFYPTHSVDVEPFSKEQSERSFLRGYKEDLALPTRINQQRLLDSTYQDKAWYLGDQRLWCSTEGREFARMIAKQFPGEVDEKTPLQLLDQPLANQPPCDYDFPVPQRPATATSPAAPTSTASSASTAPTSNAAAAAASTSTASTSTTAAPAPASTAVSASTASTSNGAAPVPAPASAAASGSTASTPCSTTNAATPALYVAAADGKAALASPDTSALCKTLRAASASALANPSAIRAVGSSMLAATATTSVPATASHGPDAETSRAVSAHTPLLLPASKTQPEAPKLCEVCMDAPVETMVLPCEHYVVCRACSDKLRATPDAHVCIQCRRGITQVVS